MLLTSISAPVSAGSVLQDSCTSSPSTTTSSGVSGVVVTVGGAMGAVCERECECELNFNTASTKYPITTVISRYKF